MAAITRHPAVDHDAECANIAVRGKKHALLFFVEQPAESAPDRIDQDKITHIEQAVWIFLQRERRRSGQMYFIIQLQPLGTDDAQM